MENCLCGAQGLGRCYMAVLGAPRMAMWLAGKGLLAWEVNCSQDSSEEPVSESFAPIKPIG